MPRSSPSSITFVSFSSGFDAGFKTDFFPDFFPFLTRAFLGSYFLRFSRRAAAASFFFFFTGSSSSLAFLAGAFDAFAGPVVG